MIKSFGEKEEDEMNKIDKNAHLGSEPGGSQKFFGEVRRLEKLITFEPLYIKTT